MSAWNVNFGRKHMDLGGYEAASVTITNAGIFSVDPISTLAGSVPIGGGYADSKSLMPVIETVVKLRPGIAAPEASS